MNWHQYPILFMGTSDFAVGFLRDLTEGGYNVGAVVTVPDKPAGRGRKLSISPVKEYALEAGLYILQPERLSEETFLEELRSLNFRLGIVVSFRMLPQAIWAMPACGTVNLHASLLPRWRGAAPINHAIMAGDNETGVTLFQLRQELDAGDIIGTRSVIVGAEETFGELHDRLAKEGQILLKEHIAILLEGSATKLVQALATDQPYAKKLTRENSKIDWKRPAVELHNFIRGLSPAPCAWTTLEEYETQIGKADPSQLYKIVSAKIDAPAGSRSEVPGTILLECKGQMQIVCGDGGLLGISTLQAPGKKALSTRDFLNGAKFPPSPRFC